MSTFGFEEFYGIPLDLVHLHSPLASHYDYGGQIGTSEGTGLGCSIISVQLRGPDAYVFVQEDPVCLLSQKRFPFCLYFVVGVGDLWGMMGDSRFFCNHSVYPQGFLALEILWFHT